MPPAAALSGWTFDIWAAAPAGAVPAISSRTTCRRRCSGTASRSRLCPQPSLLQAAAPQIEGGGRARRPPPIPHRSHMSPPQSFSAIRSICFARRPAAAGRPRARPESAAASGRPENLPLAFLPSPGRFDHPPPKSVARAGHPGGAPPPRDCTHAAAVVAGFPTCMESVHAQEVRRCHLLVPRSWYAFRPATLRRDPLST